MKILISWVALNNDYTWLYRGTVNEQKDKVRENGPTFTLHKYFGNQYDKHVLLNSSDNKKEVDFFNLLIEKLQKTFKHDIEPRQLIINDPIDIAEIFAKISSLLSEFRQHDVEVFVNPGTPQMQIAWYLVTPTFKKNVRLFQIRESRFTKSKEKPEQIYSTIDTIFNPTVLSIANEVATRQPVDNKILITETLRPIYNKAKQIAIAHDSIGCLVLGENGTGKENLATFIFENSNRKNKPFIAVNCAAYSEELLQSELFGYEKGAFTGAINQKKGIFEEANGGTIFLDEIGDISPKMQVSLLRALQEKKIHRVGGTKEIPVDVRIIAATNRDLEELCESGIFRWDLFFRLAITSLKLPPLREWRKGELKQLVDHFNSVYYFEFPNRQEKLMIGKEVLEVLANYPFKGNVRELQNLIISFYIFCDKAVTMQDLPDRIVREKNQSNLRTENEKEFIKKIFQNKSSNISQTARALGITRDTLKRKLTKYGIKDK